MLLIDNPVVTNCLIDQVCMLVRLSFLSFYGKLEYLLDQTPDVILNVK